MAIITNDNYQLRAPKPVDNRTGFATGATWNFYTTIADFLANSPYRFPSMTVPFTINGEQVEYWFVGGVADEDFVLKIGSALTPDLQEVTGQGNVTTYTITAAPAALDTELSTLGQVKGLLTIKANIAGQVFTGNISAPNLSGTNTGDQDLSPYQLISNLQSNLTASAVKYPSVDAVNAGLILKQNNLGFTPENVINKVGDLSAPNANTYLNTLGLSNLLDDKVNVSTPIEGGYGIAVGGDLSSAVSVTLNTATTDVRYLRKDQNDNNGTNTLTLGGLITEIATVQGDLTLPSLGIGTGNDILIVDGAGLVQKKTLVIAGDFGVADAAGTNQFDVALGTNLRFAGANDTTVSFDAVTNTVTFSSIPGTGGGGAVLSFNTRTGAVVPVSGDYNSGMVPEMTNLYFTEPRVRTTVLTGLTPTNTAILATDSVIQAFGKTQGQLNNKVGLTRELTIGGTAGRIMIGGGETQDLSANRQWTIDLSTIGTAGTYKSVTTDAYGRVTAGSNPTTLGGFGITDSYTKTEADGKYYLQTNPAGYITAADLSGYVDLTSTQTITGVKEFNVGSRHINGTALSFYNGNDTTYPRSSVSQMGINIFPNTTRFTSYLGPEFRVTAGAFIQSYVLPTPTATDFISFPTGSGTLAKLSDIPSLTNYALKDGSNATGIWPISVTGTATSWSESGNQYEGVAFTGTPSYLMSYDPTASKWKPTTFTGLNAFVTGSNMDINITGNAITSTRSNALFAGATVDTYGGTLETSGLGSILGIHSTGGIFKFTKGASQTFLDINNGATINNNISGNAATATNSTQWIGLTYNNASPTTAPLYVMGSADGGTYGYTPISDLKSTLGIPSGGETLPSVTARDNTAPTGIIITGGPATPTAGGNGLYMSFNGNTSYLNSITPNVAWQNLSINASRTSFGANGQFDKMVLVENGDLGLGTAAPTSNTNRTTLALNNATWGGQLDINVGGVNHAQFGTDNFNSGLSARVQSKDGIVFNVNGTTEAMRITDTGVTATQFNGALNGNANSANVWGGKSADFNTVSTGANIAYVSILDNNGIIQLTDQVGLQYYLGLGSNAYTSTPIPTNNNQLTNGAGYITSADLNGYVTTNTNQTITGIKTHTNNLIANGEIFSVGGAGYNFNLSQNGLYFKNSLSETILSISGAGTITTVGTVSADGGFFDTSDIRLKTIVDDKFDTSSLEAVSFRWKDGLIDDKVHVGYVAQEVQKVMPDAVNVDDSGKLSVNYTQVLVQEIQILKNRLAELERRIN